MNQPFYFLHDEIDKIYLEEMYNNDLSILLSVFEEYMETHDEVVLGFEHVFLQGSLNDLQKYIHKTKPIYGYLGFSNLVQSLQHFSNKCSFFTSINEAAAEFEETLLKIKEIRSIIAKELIQIKKTK